MGIYRGGENGQMTQYAPCHSPTFIVVSDLKMQVHLYDMYKFIYFIYFWSKI